MTDTELINQVMKLLDLQRKYCFRMLFQSGTTEYQYKELFKKVSNELNRRKTETIKDQNPKLF